MAGFNDPLEAGKLLNPLMEEAGLNPNMPLTNSEAQLQHIKFSTFLRDKNEFTPEQRSEIVQKYTSYTSEWQLRGEDAGNNQRLAQYNNWAANFEASENQKRQKIYNQQLNDAHIKAVEQNMAEIQNQLIDNPDLYGELSKSAIDMINKSPISDEVKQKAINSTQYKMADATFSSLLQLDPKAADQFASDNAAIFGKKIVATRVKAKKAMAAAEKASASLKKAEIKDELLGLNLDQIQTLSSTKGTQGEAAREVYQDIRENNVDAVAEQLPPLNFNQIETLEDRFAAVAEIQETLSTKQNPLDLDMLTSGDIKGIKDQLARGQGGRLAAFFANSPDAINQLNRELPALGLAAKVHNSDPELAALAVRAASMVGGTSEFSNMELATIAPYGSEALNSQLRAQLRALGKLEDHAGLDNMARRAANIGKVGTGLFSSYELPLPNRMNGGRFKTIISEVFKNADRMKKVLNDKPLGGFTPIEFEDVELVAEGNDVYSITKDGVHLQTEAGKKLLLDFKKVMDQ
jgi:hypothetical protein